MYVVPIIRNLLIARNIFYQKKKTFPNQEEKSKNIQNSNLIVKFNFDYLIK
jgi:hypothetical protein